ncbi:23S rRNA (pseudouridine(1915)-N(3))-methyltransferase RlmH [Aestuariivirga sp.]|uniref:23S rRNA (pseudouridine(1915)-N(3))-methyltransferase RlmH n=1 Tax=Aestuariivirga sp. TaxID=2650926 RepID=UPI00391D6CBB
MRLSVIAAGRLKPGPEKLLAEDYLTRASGLGRKAGIARIAVTEFPESQASSPAARMAEEARLIAGALPPRAFGVVLDERGKALASEAFAELLRRHLETGTADMAFLIGGPDGHAPETREQAGLLLSFGPMTWPHRLVRVMLFEQIYRAVTILTGHPYHRG